MRILMILNDIPVSFLSCLPTTRTRRTLGNANVIRFLVPFCQCSLCSPWFVLFGSGYALA